MRALIKRLYMPILKYNFLVLNLQFVYIVSVRSQCPTVVLYLVWKLSLMEKIGYAIIQENDPSRLLELCDVLIKMQLIVKNAKDSSN